MRKTKEHLWKEISGKMNDNCTQNQNLFYGTFLPPFLKIFFTNNVNYGHCFFMKKYWIRSRSMQNFSFNSQIKISDKNLKFIKTRYN